jgi:hypothetical protein
VLLGIAAVHVVFVIVIGRTSWYWADDFLNFAMAREKGLGAGYVEEGMFGHFVPGHRVLDWAVDRWFPLDWTAALAIQTVCALACLWFLARVLRRLTGSTGFVLLATGLSAVSVLVVPSVLWWATGLCQLPALACTLAAIDAFLVWDERRGAAPLVASVLCVVAGLVFYEKPVLVLGYLPLLVVARIPERLSGRKVLQALVLRWPAWLSYAAVIVPYSLYHRANYPQGTVRPSASAMLDFTWIAWAKSFVPALLGLSVPHFEAFGRVTPTVLLGQLAVVVLVVWSWRRDRAAWRAWVFFAIAFLANVALVGWARVGVFGPGLALDHRYFVECAPLFAIAAAVAFHRDPGTRTPDTWASADPTPVDRDEGVPERTAKAGSLRWAVVVAAAVVLLHGALAWRSSDGLADAWPAARRAKPFVANIESSLAALRQQGVEPSFAPTDVPFDIVSSAFVPYNQLDRFLPIVDPSVQFAQAGPPYVLDPVGHVVPAVRSPLFEAGPPTLTARMRVEGGELVARSTDVCIVAGADGARGTLPVTRTAHAGPWFLEAVVDGGPGATARLVTMAAEGPFVPEDSLQHVEGDRTELLRLREWPVEQIVVEVAPNDTLCVRSIALVTLTAPTGGT